MSIYKIYLPHLKRCYSPYITFLRNVYVVYILKKLELEEFAKVIYAELALDAQRRRFLYHKDARVFSFPR